MPKDKFSVFFQGGSLLRNGDVFVSFSPEIVKKRNGSVGNGQRRFETLHLFSFTKTTQALPVITFDVKSFPILDRTILVHTVLYKTSATNLDVVVTPIRKFKYNGSTILNMCDFSRGEENAGMRSTELN